MAAGLYQRFEHCMTRAEFWRCRCRINSRILQAKERGIEVYQPWLEDYNEFLAYLITLPGWEEWGQRSSKKLSVDRIDNDRGYVPGNLRFATWIQQANNKRNNIAKRLPFYLANGFKEKFITLRKDGVPIRVIAEQYFTKPSIVRAVLASETIALEPIPNRKKLKEWRLQLRITQQRLSEETGIRVEHICKLERNSNFYGGYLMREHVRHLLQYLTAMGAV